MKKRVASGLTQAERQSIGLIGIFSRLIDTLTIGIHQPGVIHAKRHLEASRYSMRKRSPSCANVSKWQGWNSQCKQLAVPGDRRQKLAESLCFRYIDMLLFIIIIFFRSIYLAELAKAFVVWDLYFLVQWRHFPTHPNSLTSLNFQHSVSTDCFSRCLDTVCCFWCIITFVKFASPFIEQSLDI